MLKTLSLSFILLATSLFGAGIEGKYQISGFDPYSNTRYTGTAEVKNKGQLYEITWNISPLGLIYDGTGIKVGNSISFVFETTKNSKREVGLQIYAINGDTLSGEWTYLYGDKKGTETLKKIKTAQ